MTRTRIERTAALAMLALLATGGCSRGPKQPTGQVAAIVDGIEITDAMIDAEGRARALPATAAGSPQMRKRLLSGIVDRTALAAQSRKDALDRTPEALADLDRLREDFAARLLLSKRIVPRPIGAGDVQRYITGHPELSSDRTILQVDQVRYWNTGTAAGTKYLWDAQYLDEVLRNLTETHTPFERKVVQLDPIADGTALVARLATTPPAQLYHYEANGVTVVGSVVGRSTSRLSSEQADEVARNRLRRADIDKQVSDLLGYYRKRAQVTYRAEPR